MSVLQKMALATTGAGQLTLGDAFDVKFGRRAALSTKLSNETQNIRDKALQKKSNADTKGIETALNKFFYPTDKQPLMNRDQLKQEMLNDMINTMVQKIQNVANNAASLSDSNFKSAYSGDENATGFQLQRISNMITQAKSRMEQFVKTVDSQNLEKISKGITQMEDLQNQLFSLVQEYATNEKTTIKYNHLDLSKRSQVMSLLKTIYLLYEAIDNKLKVEDWQVFERALAETNKYFVDGTVEEIKESIIKSLVGSNMVSRGSGNTTLQISANVSSSDLKEKQGFKLNGSKASFTFTPYSKKQGKIDVQFDWNEIYGGTKEDYRVSAKKWSNGFSKFGLGTTSIFNAIARSASFDWVNGYALGLLRTEDQFKWVSGLPPAIALNEAHKMAKLSLLTDIGMGISQQQGYANLLVIDMGNQIKVYSLADMINNYLKGQEQLFSFAGYEESKIEAAMNQIYNNKIRRIGRTSTQLRTNTYFSLAANKLNQMKVTLHPHF